MANTNFRNTESVDSYRNIFWHKPFSHDLDPTICEGNDSFCLYRNGYPRMNVNGMLELFSGFVIIGILPDKL